MEPIEKIDKLVIELLELLDQITPGAENTLIGPNLRNALNYAKQRADYRNQEARDRQADHVRSMEDNLKRAQDTLAKYHKLAKQTRYSLDGERTGPVVPAEGLQRLEEKVKSAERNLAQARGQAAEYDQAIKDAIREKSRQERLQEAEGVARWQKAAREASEAAGKEPKK
jgi:hypothetical protein